MGTDTAPLQHRYPELFRRSRRAPLIAAAVLATMVGYFVYAVWFFNVPTVIATALGERFGRLSLQAEKRREEMRFEVMDGMERAAQGPGCRLTERETDEQRTDEARTAGGGDEVDIGERHAGAGEGFAPHRRPVVQVLARGDLGNDTAVRAVRCKLARHHRGEHAPVGIDERAGGVVTGGFDAERQRPSHDREA